MERERLRALFLDTLNDHSSAARKRRDFAACTRYAERLLLEYDLREDALRELVAARYELGDRSAALAIFERYAQRLRDVLDVEPMSQTLALRDAIAADLPTRTRRHSSAGVVSSTRYDEQFFVLQRGLRITRKSVMLHARRVGSMRWVSWPNDRQTVAGDAALDARAYLHMVGSGIADAQAPLTQAAALAHEIGDDALHDRLAIRLANVQLRLGKATAALEALGRRRTTLESVGSPAEWIDLLNAEVNCFFIIEDFEIGARAGHELLMLAARVGDVESENRAHSALSYVANVRGDATAMRFHSDLALAAFERAGRGRLLAVALCNRGAAEIELGRIDEALTFWERAHRGASRCAGRRGNNAHRALRQNSCASASRSRRSWRKRHMRLRARPAKSE